jgi:hypothetical protein
VEVGWEGDAGEFTLEVGGVAGAVLGVVEDGVGSVPNWSSWSSCIECGIIPTVLTGKLI